MKFTFVLVRTDGSHTRALIYDFKPDAGSGLYHRPMSTTFYHFQIRLNIPLNVLAVKTHARAQNVILFHMLCCCPPLAPIHRRLLFPNFSTVRCFPLLSHKAPHIWIHFWIWFRFNRHTIQSIFPSNMRQINAATVAVFSYILGQIE